MGREQEKSGSAKELASGNKNYNHLKWPAIIIGVLVILLIVLLDQCSRTGAL